jgi:tRNA(fMet)-specific endonuclease VapC
MPGSGTVPIYVLDTDHVSLFQRGDERVQAAVLSCPPETLGVAIITAEEQFRGRLAQIRRARPGKERVAAYANLHATMAYFAGIRAYDFTPRTEATFAALRSSQLRIGTQDLRIAATALSLGATVVTRNRADFGRVAGLTTEDWSTSWRE